MTITLSTPFGGRNLSIEMIDGQRISVSCAQNLTADKWQILRDITDCRKMLELSDRSLAVLSALLSFHKDDVLCGHDNLIVFPSNTKLRSRAYGMSEPTLRRHLASLVKAGLLIRRDSPNGKRYARRDHDGTIMRAFGFDLKPLLVRAADFHQMAEATRQEARLIQTLKEDITILRRNISKSLSYGTMTSPSDQWSPLMERLATLQQRTDRRLCLATLKELHASLYTLAQDVDKLLNELIFFKEVNGSHAQNERHIEDSNKDKYFDSEEGTTPNPTQSKTEIHTDQKIAIQRTKRQKSSATQTIAKSTLQEKSVLTEQSHGNHFDLETILEACPKITHCSRFRIRSWTDLIETADHVSQMLSISSSAWHEAKMRLGLVSASVTVAALLERCDSIRSPGGYLRSLISKDGFSPRFMIEALLSKTIAQQKLA